MLSGSVGLLGVSSQAPPGSFEVDGFLAWLDGRRFVRALAASDRLEVSSLDDLAAAPVFLESDNGQLRGSSPNGRWVIVRRRLAPAGSEFYVVAAGDPSNELRIGVSLEAVEFLPDSSALLLYGERTVGERDRLSVIDLSGLRPRDLGALDFGIDLLGQVSAVELVVPPAP